MCNFSCAQHFPDWKQLHINTHTLSLSLPLSPFFLLTHTHTYTHAHTHTQTHTYTHTHTHIPTYLVSIECSSFRSSQLCHCSFLYSAHTNKNPSSFTFNIPTSQFYFMVFRSRYHCIGKTDNSCKSCLAKLH